MLGEPGISTHIATRLPSGELTFLFTDIEGSTRLLHDLGDRYAQTLADHQQILLEAFVRHNGSVVRVEGDGSLVAFERPEGAIAAALYAQQLLRTHAWPPGAEVHVRMGLHHGSAVAVGRDYVGLAVHAAARICDAAHGGQIVVSEEVREAAAAQMPSLSRLLDLGEHRLKDLPDACRLYQLAHPDLRSDFPPLRAIAVLPNNLPALLTTFVGRRLETTSLVDRLEKNRLVSVVGPGGSGKTRVALEVGARVVDRFPDGVWMVEFASVTTHDEVLAETARVLGIRERSGRGPLETMLSELRPRNMLVVFDNCEHVVEATAELAETLLHGCPNLRILATTREPLGLEGEVPFALPPLPVPEPGSSDPGSSDAVRLFAHRAATVAPGFEISDANVDAVVQICRRLDGIPLAIELAAALVGRLAPTDIAARLDDRFELLTGTRRGGLPHHKTLRATIDWSWHLLTEPQRTLLRRLAIFPATFTLDAVEHVAGFEPGGNVFEHLTRLVETSLVTTYDHGPHLRYRLLETIRAYAEQRLDEAGETAEIRDRHMGAYLDLVDRVSSELQTLASNDRMFILDDEYENLSPALDRALDRDPARALRTATALEPYWAARGLFDQGRRVLEAALGAGAGDPAERSAASSVVGGLAEAQGDYSQARQLHTSTLSLARASADDSALTRSLMGLGNVEFHTGDYDAARGCYDEALEVYRRRADTTGIAQALHNLATIAATQGDTGTSRELFDECLDLRRRAGNRQAVAETLNNLGVLARLTGDMDQARSLGEEGLELARELRHRPLMAAFLINLGIVATRDGRAEAAWVSYLEALELYREMGSADGEAGVLNSLGGLAYYHDRLEDAADRYEASLDIRRGIGDRRGVAECLNNLGTVARQMGNAERASACHIESLRIREELDDRRGIARSLTAVVQSAPPGPAETHAMLRRALQLSMETGDLENSATTLEAAAEAAVVAGHLERAALLLGASDAARDRTGALQAPSAHRQRDALLRSLHHGLHRASLDALLADGRSMGPEQAARLIEDHPDPRGTLGPASVG